MYLITTAQISKILFLLDINVAIDSLHNHTRDDTNKHQMRGNEKIELGLEICANHGGSAYDARFSALGIADSKGDEHAVSSVPTANQYNKAKQAFRKKDLPSTNWITNLMYVLSTGKADGVPYIRELTLGEDFKMVKSY